MKMDTIRAFIAIELPDDIKNELEEIKSVLMSGNSTPAKWVNPESIHLTLQFLGDISSDRVTEILDAIKRGVGGTPSFQIQLAGLGVFPNPARTQVVWTGIAGDIEQLKQLQKSIEIEMEKLNFPREKRNFTPHLTLARVRDHATPGERKRLGDMVTDTPFTGGIMRVDSVDLMKSHLTRQGALYTRLGSIRLG
jgi:2'-5' RNA ligase